MGMRMSNSHVFFFDVRNTLGVTQLYRAHGAREDDEMFKEIGDLLTDEDDAVVCGMMERLGPPDITLHYDMIQGMEKDLGVMPR
jgi:hypothetical protein